MAAVAGATPTSSSARFLLLPTGPLDTSTSTTSRFNLFPTASIVTQPAGGAGDPQVPTSSDFLLTEPSTSSKPEHHGKPDIYYLVLLGILVVLIVFAALLTMRGHRMRRRYRTATQLAIARGEPVSWWRDGGDAADVLGIHAVFRNGPPPPGPPEHWANVGSRKKPRRWVRIPVLWDAEVSEPDVDEMQALMASRREGESEKWSEEGGAGTDAARRADDEDDWDAVQPLTVHSLLPDTTPLPAQPSPGPPPPVSVLGLLRYGLTSSPPPAPPPTAPAPAPRREREADRVCELGDGEPLRLAFMVQMPILPEEAERERMRRERERDDDEEEAGWRAGMEIGVWEGEVENGTEATYPPPPTPRDAPSSGSTPGTPRSAPKAL